jgi:hypothetical protein
MADRTGLKSKKSRAGWVILLVLGLAVVLAVKLGWAGFGWAQLKSMVYPGSDGLLEWVPADTQAVAIVDPHQVHAKSLGSQQGAARVWLDRVRNDVKNAAGVDLVYDVDKLAITPTLVVMSGRFDGEKLATRLAEYRYTKAEHGGRSYLVRAGEDALMAVDDDRLLYGDEASIQAAIDAKAGTSLANNEQVTARLARTGYKQPLVATVSLGGERPSLRSMITGSTGPRAVSLGVRSANGVDLQATIDAASGSAADDLARLLDEKRAGLAGALQATTGPELGTLLAKVAHDTIIKADPSTSEVDLRTHVASEDLDALVKSAETSAPLTEAYKALRLYQLLAPSPYPASLPTLTPSFAPAPAPAPSP